MIRNWFRWRTEERPFLLTLYCTSCRERIDTERRVSAEVAKSTMSLWRKYHAECHNVGHQD